jgi:hypothetical protein
MRLPGAVAVLLVVLLWSGSPSILLRRAGGPSHASAILHPMIPRDPPVTRALAAMPRPTP